MAEQGLLLSREVVLRSIGALSFESPGENALGVKLAQPIATCFKDTKIA